MPEASGRIEIIRNITIAVEEKFLWPVLDSLFPQEFTDFEPITSANTSKDNASSGNIEKAARHAPIC